MQRTKTKRTALVSLSVTIILVIMGVLIVQVPSQAQTGDASSEADISDLEAQIREKNAAIEELQRQQNVYEDAVSQKQQEALSLQNQIGILDSQISNTDLGIRKLELQIDELGLEVEKLQVQIDERNAEIRQQKERLGEMIRLLQRNGDKTILEISLLNKTFSEFFNQLKYLETIDKKAKKSLDNVVALKTELETEKTAQEQKKKESEDTKNQLDIQRGSLIGQQSYREDLLTDTKDSESQYQALLDKAKQEQSSANTDIQSLERQIRSRLEGTEELTTSDLIWPIPSRRITAYFHDPGYIFRRYFEHPAIDIATPQGTPVHAAASGYVARAKDAGMGYSYIMIVHGNNLSTVYGHISKIMVQEDAFVVQGQVIGLSGATPGTPGAGRLTTGPHLHLEVRLNGIPVDPLNYLP